MIENKLILVDGSSYLYRAYHAYPNFRNSKDFPTGAIYGVLNMLKSLIKQFPSYKLIVVFDAKGKTFRDDLYPSYKANREKMPSDLSVQIPLLFEIIELQNIDLISVSGVEADDVIGTLAVKAEKLGYEVVISTGDKDLAQLVTNKVTLINTMTNETLNIEGVKAKYGFGPNLIIDYLALMGDSSDNIPGVQGVGEKTAKSLLAGIGSLEDIYNNLEKIKDLNFRGSKTLAKKLEQERDMALLSYELATIKIDVEFDDSNVFNAKSQKKSNNQKQLNAIYEELNFKKWLENEASFNETTIVKKNYKSINDNEAFSKFLITISESDFFAFDTETDSLDPFQANLVGISFSLEDNTGYYIPLQHNLIENIQLDLNYVLTNLKGLLESQDHCIIGQNIKYDRNVLLKYGINLSSNIKDTMILSHVLDSVSRRHSLDSLAQEYFNYKMTSYEEITGKGKNKISFDQVDIETATKYASEDADLTYQLYFKMLTELDKDSDSYKLYEEIELPLINVLSRMEYTGVLIDSQLLLEQSKQIQKELDGITHKIFEISQEKFNINSTKQLQRILFEKLELPIIKKTPTGAASTNEEVLQQLALDFPLPRLILEYRTLFKLKSTYLDKLPKMVNIKSGRIHTSYNQIGTITGRLSSSDPNLQNIPVKGQRGKDIRKAFIAEKGNKIVSIDYSQIELRIMAHLSGDEYLMDAFRSGKDIHSATAAEIFNTSIELVDSDQRRKAKAINFGLIYGMSAFGLSKQLDITRAEAQKYIDLYFEKYSGVLNYMNKIKEDAKSNLYVKTLMGRKLNIPDITSKNMMKFKAAERMAINAPMQGTAADIIKLAMLNIEQYIQKNDLSSNVKMIMQVHDELIFEINTDMVNEVSYHLKSLMETAVKLDVPLIADMGIGFNWGEAH
ncbi:DNA polymerase I [Paraphotobacterium marinum]|uniref:DNA polymerase I n=1 Tax=Paraphotobacterium marinum TaxID=1755811 RepID=UPI0039E966F8